MHKGIKIALWISFTILVMITLAFTSKKHDETLCKKPIITIEKYGDNNFLNEKIILTTLFNKGFKFKDQYLSEINIMQVEQIVKELPEVEAAEVYKNIDGTIRIDITERNPVLRIFNNRGQSFYVDHNGEVMPLSNHFVSHTHVATGNINIGYKGNKQKLTDNSIVSQLYAVADHIRNDEFLNSQIVQIDVDKKQEIVLIPRVGEQKILFGKGTNIEDKFKRLKIFYKKGIKPHELNNYTTLNLKYKQQIICSKR